MSAVVQSRRPAPLRGFTEQDVRRSFGELHALVRDLQRQVAEARGLTAGAVVLGQHLDVQGNRLERVGPTRHEDDAPSVRELRAHALYARGGIHETDKLIFARAGVRTVTPAVAPNDLVTLGQVRRLVGDVGGTTAAVNARTGDTTVTPGGAWTWPQTAVTLANGLTSDWQVPGAVFLRIAGPTAAFAVGGLREVDDGRLVILQNTTAQVLTLVNEDAATPAAHRITTGAGGDVTMAGPGMTMLVYATQEARWWML
jgi:hypothetical protein